MRHCRLVLCAIAAASWAAAASPAAISSARWEREGRSLFLACDFKQATRAFERAVAARPESADLQYWLGKSYARWAETSGPLSAPRQARKARHSLEEAVRIEPRNRDYWQELFEFYLDSPEWFGGGLRRAEAMLERTTPREWGSDPAWKQLADARQEHSGGGWRLRQAILWTSGTLGSIVPQP